MLILGIESTCDETGASIVKNGNSIISNIISSSVNKHKKFGGIVPEVAAREQLKIIIPVISEAIAHIPHAKIDAIAVSFGPGLQGSLLIGVETSKILSLVWNKPLIGVNHLIGHIYANWLTNKSRNKKISINFPLIALIVSGGHTDLVLMQDHGKYKWLGGTLDDAAGEAFDKAGRVLDLGYPGGPQIDKLASTSTINNDKFILPRPMINSNDYNFSFSGIKTSVINQTNNIKNNQDKIKMAIEFQQAVTEVLIIKTLKAAKKYQVKSILVGGGVAANSYLRSEMKKESYKNSYKIFFPEKNLAVDNGAMIAAAAYYNFKPIKIINLQTFPGLAF